MRIVGIVGSPRKGGNTEVMANETLRGAEKAGAETELITLFDKDLQICCGCREHVKSGGFCCFRDDLQPIIEKLKKGKGIVFGSPCYLDGASSLMKVFMDRLMCCWSRQDNLVQKKAAIVVVGSRGKESTKFAVQNLRRACHLFKLSVVGSV
jgi:multimeric flavodoxin WrbA